MNYLVLTRRRIRKVPKSVFPKNFKREDIPKLRYGIIHSQIGFVDGVSIIIEEIEKAMTEDMSIPKSNIFYLVGRSKHKSPYVRQRPVLWHKHPVNQLVEKNFETGLGGELSERLESAISKAKQQIKKFVDDKKIDVIIAHNTSHPVNFITSVALSRYYRDEIREGKNTPKYILWWHDSHLERERYSHPSSDIKNYLLEGVPGKYVEYIIFINRLQFDIAQPYFKEIDKRYKGYYDYLLKNHTVVYNTVSTLINTFEDLEKEEFKIRIEKFLKDFKILELLEKNNLRLGDVQFCLQHTRIVRRKRIDFALRYAYEVFMELKKRKKIKAFIFLISGVHGDERGDYKKELIRLNRDLSEKYKTDKFFLIFAEDYKSDISFEEIPLLISKLGGFSTYFSEIEGFGNNLLEVMAAGLIPIVYTYPVFKKDLAKYKFKLIALENFEITKSSIRKLMRVLNSDFLKRRWANTNIEILKKKFSHRIIAPKLTRAIIRRRILRI